MYRANNSSGNDAAAVESLFRLLRDVKRHLSSVRGILCLPLGGIKAHQAFFHIIKDAVYVRQYTPS